tara:strand:+ start:1922 stop:2413 length:492 start_codon:yes stop_codon:yes gene_type:complete
MKKLIILAAFILPVPSALSDITHSIQNSVSLTVGGATTSSERLGSSFSISGTGVDVTDGTTAGTISAGTITSGVYSPGTIAATQNATSGESFSFSQSYTQADALATGAPTVGEVPNFSDVTSTAGGTAGSLAGSITSAGVVSITAGGANTEAVGQVVSTLSSH